MTAAALSACDAQARGRSVSREIWPVVVLLVAALALRLPRLGDPLYHIDEQFYLLVGDRMLHGALPFVDIWDRKPIGLFLIYAAIRLLGGDGIVQYQLVATMFAAATAWMIHLIARRPAGNLAGVLAGLLYLVWIETVEGGGGQAPVFYNLFVAGAAACTLAAADTYDPARLRRQSLAAMAFAGVAIQIKYTAVFESCFFGLLLAWWTLARTADIRAAACRIALLAGLALAPTLTAFALYAALGHARLFVFTNFVSIFQRGPADPTQLHYRVVELALHMLPLGLCFGASLWELRDDRSPNMRRWLWIVGGWMVAALIGFFSVGALFFHYMLPLFVPFTVAAAPILRRRPLGWVLAGLLAWLPGRNLGWPDYAAAQDGRQRIAALTALVPRDVAAGCMQMFGGPPLLYKTSGACLATPFIFPNHLVSTIERPALGVDTAATLKALLARRPRVLVTDNDAPSLDPELYGLVQAAARSGYVRTGAVEIEGRQVTVWVSRPLGYSPSLSSRD